MEKKIFIIMSLLFFCLRSNAQIIIEKIEKEQKIVTSIKFPKYENTEDFVDYNTYYSQRKTPENERCIKSDFYNRYIDLQIYYPSYNNDYKKDETLIFTKTDKLNSLKWTDIGEKYFTIQRIHSSFKDSNFFAAFQNMNDKIAQELSDNILIELKDNLTNEIIYVVEPEYNINFIVVPFHKSVNEFLNSNIFIAIENFSADKIPLGDKLVQVDKGTEWKAKLKLVRKKDFHPNDSSQHPNEQEIIFGVILTRSPDTIIVHFNAGSDYRNLFNMFITKSEYESQKKQLTILDNNRLNSIIKKYGEKYGRLIFQEKIIIGMTKEMCIDAWGMTYNRSTTTTASVKTEIWKYAGKGTLIFKNSKLYSIIKN